MAGKDVLKRIENALRINPASTKQKLVAFIKKRVSEAGADGVVVGLSGGLDSSVTAILCTKALGASKVIGVSMPEAGVTDPRDVADAREVANKLGIAFRIVDISPAVLGVRQNLTDYQIGAQLPAANIKPRVRMTILYYYANLLNRLVVGSSNRSELRAGYFTKFGDGGADLLPLGYLYKTQVRQLAAYLGLSKQVIDKVPSAGLWRGQTDEGELGISYEKLDMIYAGLDLKLKPETIAKAVGIDVERVGHFIERERRVAHKLRPPEIPKL
ncbi:MAG: NAD+ synthase [Candidatus Hodarchaeaceae archaeon]|nr:NAD+ synthase [Candidatus Hodarchaeaceae archaeon]